MNYDASKPIVFNGRKITEAEFKKIVQESQSKKGVVLQEVGPNEYKQRVQG